MVYKLSRGDLWLPRKVACFFLWTTLYIEILHNFLQIWTNKVARNFIIAQWLLSFIAITPLLFYFDFEISVAADNRTILLQWVTFGVPLTQIYTYFVNGLVYGFIAISIVVVYAIIFLSALKRKVRRQ